MDDLSFFDTNILVYADDVAFPDKHERAVGLLKEHIQSLTAVLSIQVLQEYFAAVTRKLRKAR